MKIRFLLFCLLFCFNKFLFSNDNIIQDFIKTNDITIGLRFNDNSRNLAGVIFFENGKIDSDGNGTFSVIIDPQFTIHSNGMEIYFSRILAKNIFDINRKYILWTFPKRYRIDVTYAQLVDAKNSLNKFISILVDTTQTYPTSCQAIIIDNLNIRDKPALSGEKIGLLKKGSEVTLYEESKNEDEIYGEKNFWYKVETSYDKTGWVYGGYVRIFFKDDTYKDDVNQTKEKILESLE